MGLNISANTNASARLAEPFRLLAGRWGRMAVATAILAPAIALGAPSALADEGGNGFRLPGLDGSFAAAPQAPGWGFASVYIQFEDHANGTLDTTLGNKIAVGLHAQDETLFLVPSYTFHDPILGGQLQLSVGDVVLEGLNLNVSHVSINGTELGPASSSVVGLGELYPAAQMRWNFGVHNFMLFMDGGIPVGSYEKDRLANTGKNVYSIDGGAGYTYFDKATGHELTGVLGISNSWPNPATDYRNGNAVHFNWGTSQHISRKHFRRRSRLRLSADHAGHRSRRRSRTQPVSRRFDRATGRIHQHLCCCPLIPDTASRFDCAAMNSRGER